VERWRWIENGPADGATQMAIDRAILENADSFGKVTVRVYRWKPYCISLGYHQSVENIDLDRCQQDGIDVVRRPSGGRAVLHAEEITYSIIIPAGSLPFSATVGEVYNFISRGLVRGIQKLGVLVQLQKRSLDFRSHYKTSLSVSCFSAAARHEVVIEEKKLVGSAQFRLAGRILQHGSILMGDAHLALPDYLKGIEPEERDQLRLVMEKKTASINRYLGRKIEYGEAAKALRQGMEEEFSVEFEDGKLTEKEQEQILHLRKTFSILSTNG